MAATASFGQTYAEFTAEYDELYSFDRIRTTSISTLIEEYQDLVNYERLFSRLIEDGE